MKLSGASAESDLPSLVKSFALHEVEINGVLSVVTELPTNKTTGLAVFPQN